MSAGRFRERLRKIRGLADRPGMPPLDSFDAEDDLHVDEAARALIERFRDEADVDAFTLLFELTHDRLLLAAARITRQLGGSIDPEDLVAGFMSRLFCDVGRRPGSDVRRFLGFAHTSMRNDMLDQLRRHKRAVAKRRTYADTLDEPPDPSALIEHAEERETLVRCGLTLLDITGSCFEELEDRDRQVLMAREILGLPYDRVASMLGLDPDQVGMIIRRARKHLVDRILVNLSTSSEDDEQRAEDINRLQHSLTSNLDARQRTRSVKVLLERMLSLSKASARSKLSDLLYEMAKACLVARPDFAERITARTEPRSVDEVAGDIREIEGRLDRVGDVHGGTHLDSVLTDPPRRETAMDDARRCLSMLETLEGPSGRQRVALALCEIHDGRPALGEEILRDLEAHADDYELTLVTRQNVSRNIQLALLRQARWAEARSAAETAAEIWPIDPVRVTNLCFAAARLLDVGLFESSVRELAAIHAAEPSAMVASWIDGPLRDLGRDLSLPEGRLDELVAAAPKGKVVDADAGSARGADGESSEEGA